MLFTELRASIVARLRRAMPKEVRVLPHPGPLDEEELVRICFGDPSLLVAVLGVNGVDRGRGHSAAELRLGVYVACGPGKAAIPADTSALAIIPRTLATIYGENWDMQNVESRPEDIRAENLYSGKIGAGLLVALWGASSCRNSIPSSRLPPIPAIPTARQTWTRRMFPSRGAIPWANSCAWASLSKPNPMPQASHKPILTTSSP